MNPAFSLFCAISTWAVGQARYGSGSPSRPHPLPLWNRTMGAESLRCRKLVTQEKGREIPRSGGNAKFDHAWKESFKSFSPDCDSSIRVASSSHKALHRRLGLSHIFRFTAGCPPHAFTSQGCYLYPQPPGSSLLKTPFLFLFF